MNSNSILRRTALIIALLSAAMAAGAGAEEPAPSRVISFADLNLESPAGIRVLYRRIQHAADLVCELPRETRRLRSDVDLKICRSNATEQAVRLVNLPALDAVHAAQQRRADPTRVARSR